MVIFVEGQKLTWWQSFLFRLALGKGGHSRLVSQLVDHEVEYRRENLRRREPPNIDPRYPDIDTVREEWGLPTTDAILEDMRKKFDQWLKDRPTT